MLASAILALAALGAAGHAKEEPPGRLVRLDAVDRFGERVGASACVVTGETCAPVPRSGDASSASLVLPPGHVRLRVTAPGFAAREVDVPVSADTLRVRLTATGSVVGSAVSLDGRRASSLDIRLAPEEIDSRRAPITARLDLPAAPKPARLEMPDVPSGTWRLGWVGPGVAAGEKRVRVGEAAADVGRLPLAPGVTLEGTVRDDLGSPIPRAGVHLAPKDPDSEARPFDTVSDENGAFAVRGVPATERHRWIARARGYVAAEGETGGESRLEIVLERAERLTGRVVDDDGNPVDGARVTLVFSPAKGSFIAGAGEEITDRDGAFSIFRERRSRASLSVRAGSFRRARRALPEAGVAAVGRETDLGTIRLERGRRIAGRVTDAETEAPLPGVRVEVTGPTRNEDGFADFDAGSATTADDGRYQVDGLGKKSRLTVHFAREGYATARRVLAEDEEGIDVTLGRGGRIEGRVCGDGLVLSSSQVRVGRSRLAGEAPMRPGSDGTFRVERAEAGPWVASLEWAVFGPDGSPRAGMTSTDDPTSAFRVRDGEIAHVTIGCEGVAVSGRVARDGRPLGEARGWLRPLEGPEGSGALFGTDALGRFAARVRVPGPYGVIVWLPGERAFLTGTAPCLVTASGGSCAADVAPESSQGETGRTRN